MAFGQADTIAADDKVLTITEFFDVVLRYHPVVRQTRYLSELAQQELRLAQGNFDPLLKSDLSIKEFGDKTYYNTWDSKLEVPIWFNTDLNVGFERNRGVYLNEQLQNTEDGLIYAGVTVPIGRGLFTDERRNAVRQARLLQGVAEADQLKEINKVLLTAAKSYWDWYFAYQNYEVVQEVEQLAERRYRALVQQVANGDVAPFDSLKAYINYQERLVQLRQADLDYQNASLFIANFLWTEQDDTPVPLEVAPGVHPVLEAEIVALNPDELRQLALANHPDLIKLSIKEKQLKVERSLRREFLKPEINLKYNFLNQPADFFSGNGAPFEENIFMNDYKLGLQVYFPLFLRKERAKLAQTRIKLEQNFYERSFQRVQMVNEINASYNTWQNTDELLALQAQMVKNYEALLQGEIIKFENGESDVFLINTRETELLEARVKLLKLETQYQKARMELLYAAGLQNLQQP